MSKGPTPRHSKPSKPVTIDLDATDVTPKMDKSVNAGATTSTTGPGAKSDSGDTVDKAEKAVSSSQASPAQTKSGADVKTAAAGDDAKLKGDAPKAASDKLSSTPKMSASNRSETAKPMAKPSDTSSNKASEADKSAQSSVPPGRPMAAPKSGGGGLGMVASGVIGAVIALGGAYGLMMSGVVQAPNSGVDTSALVSQVGVLNSKVETLTDKVSSVGTSETGMSDTLSARLDSLEKAVAQVRATASVDPAALEALQTRLSTLEAAIAKLQEAGGAAIRGAIDPSVTADLASLRSAQAGLETSLTQLQSQISDISGKLEAVSGKQAEMAAQLDKPDRQIDVAKAIAAAGLKSAIDRGGPFMSELEAFASVAPENPAIAPLRGLAAAGVPSRETLLAEFSDAANAAIAAANPVDPKTGLVDRLVASAMAVVKVRKVGDVEGDSAEAIVARVETRLKAGQLNAALEQWNTLPEASKTAAADFGKALSARTEAEKLVSSMMIPLAAQTSSKTLSQSPAQNPSN